MSKQTAYTAPNCQYPEYVNFTTEDNGSNILTVRTQGAQNSSVINLPPAELLKIGTAMVERAVEQLADEE